ncbi:hypothetical protein Dimus_037882 [Dionaea muscipula]
MKKHLRPLYLKAEINDVPVNCVLIDNGATINTIPYRMLKKFGKTETNLMSSLVALTGFSGEVAESKEMIALDITIGSMTRTTLLFIMSASTNYNILLGRDWIHGSGCIPTSLHQCIVLWDENGSPEIVQADSRPSTTRGQRARDWTVRPDPTRPEPSVNPWTNPVNPSQTLPNPS